jgi:hypothetical protein
MREDRRGDGMRDDYAMSRMRDGQRDCQTWMSECETAGLTPARADQQMRGEPDRNMEAGPLTTEDRIRSAPSGTGQATAGSQNLGNVTRAKRTTAGQGKESE